MPCDEALLLALKMDDKESQLAVVKAVVKKWSFWHGDGGLWWDPFLERKDHEWHCVPLLAIAAKYASVETLDYISSDIIGAGGGRGFFRPTKRFFSPVREAVLAGRANVVKYLVGNIGNANHWAHDVQLVGCNCDKCLSPSDVDLLALDASVLL